jgi:chromosome segregation protein
VEAIVTSKPRDRRLLLEEAAGLGKHRKRRRRAQLKLERTQANLDRALDVEREARTRLRPLKRQAEAAELHERLERQTAEARWELARDAVRARAGELEAAAARAAEARAARDAAQAELDAVAARREEAEEALARRTERREELAHRAYRAGAAAERVEGRLERTREAADRLAERLAARGRRLEALRAQAARDEPDEAGRRRTEALEAELERLDAQRAAELERELASLAAERAAAAARVAALARDCDARQAALAEADEACDVARAARRAAETSAERARREAAGVGAELASANQFLRSHAGAVGRPAGASARSLAGELVVEPGCELALAAALGGRLDAAIVADLPEASELLDGAGRDGGRALLAEPDAPAPDAPPAADARSPAGAVPPDGAAQTPPPPAADAPPAPGARPLADLVSGPARPLALARRLLAGAWLVDDLAAVAPSFRGIAVTPHGRAWLGATRELRQAGSGGAERVLAERNRRDALLARSQEAVRAEQAALAAVETAAAAVAAADATRDEADTAAREAERARAAAQEAERRAGWLLEQRRRAPEEGPGAVRRAQLRGELAAERRAAERAARERAERTARAEWLAAGVARDTALQPAAERLARALEAVLAAARERVVALEADLAADREAGEGIAATLRACAGEEAEIQRRLRELGEAVTAAEVRAQQARDQAAEAAHELREVAERLGLPADPRDEPLAEEAAAALRQRIERLARRREQLGPVNPLARAEYDEALAHVEELERQRGDLETAMRELRALIRETDRQIRETFEETFAAAARSFEELAAQLFPGGRGRLRLVREDSGPRPVLGGAEAEADAGGGGAGAEAEASERAEGAPDDDLGVEIEITPAGKATKRLTLLSGGEKSMTAIAFLFAVFLARPCPFYVLDEVEAALDDLNITRFLDLLRRYADRAQFIVVTHQKRTMEAADTLYGVSMGDDGVSKVVSRRLPQEAVAGTEAARAAGAA